ncbi:MAG: hypothetical protein ACO3OL_15790, partial [bacterium]
LIPPYPHSSWTQPRNRNNHHPEWILPRGWIDDGQDKSGESSNPRARSLNLSEIQKIRRVGNCLPCHHQEERFFQDFKSWRSDLPEDHPPL